MVAAIGRDEEQEPAVCHDPGESVQGQIIRRGGPPEPRQGERGSEQRQTVAPDAEDLGRIDPAHTAQEEHVAGVDKGAEQSREGRCAE